MKQALIIGASGGIGAALVTKAQSLGYHVTSLSRSDDGLDITSEVSVDAHLSRLTGPFDLIFVATGALQINGAQPEKSLKQIEAAMMADQFAVNAIGPALILRHAGRLMPRDRRAVFAALSARVGSIGDNRLGGWYSYRASKAALNQIIHTASIELARTHPLAIVTALHPGTVATSFTSDFVKASDVTPPSKAAGHLLTVTETLGVTGGFYDYAGKSVTW